MLPGLVVLCYAVLLEHMHASCSTLWCCLLCAALQGEAGGPAAAAAAAAAGGRRSSSTPAGIKTAQRWTQEEHDLLLQVCALLCIVE
jgi:hypothetical protein